MGYERKRGKLTEFNALLRGGSRDCFSEIVGRDGHPAGDQICHHARHRHPAAARRRPPARRHDGPSVEPPGVRCRARDCHRRLRHSAAARRREPAERAALLVRPAVCRRRGHRSLHAGGVRRLSGCVPAKARSSARASTMWTPSSGPWRGRFPENTVLSHDLLESCHARSALVSDVEFYEEYPSRYNVDIDRRHRWIRGDWQITQWLLPRVPGCGRPAHRQSAFRCSRNGKFSTTCGAVSFPRPCCSCCSAAGCSCPNPAVWDRCWSLAIIALPGLLAALVNALRKPQDLPWAMHLREVAGAGAPAARPDLSHPGLSALRRLHQPGRHRQDAGAPAGDAQTAARMANVERFRTHHARRPRRFLCHHVDRAGRRAGRPDSSCVLRASGATAAGAAAAGRLAGRPVDRLVDQPADCSPRRRI